jgi:putative addiction module antidote
MRDNERMSEVMKIEEVGGSAALILPQALLDHLGVQIGQSLVVTNTARGVELVSAAGFDGQMSIAREVMAKHRAALRELAKR